MANLSDWLELVVPEETTNQISNPSFETDTSAWSGSGGALTRVAGGVRGAYCGQFLGTVVSAAIAADLPSTGGAGGTSWTVSGWVKASSTLVSLDLYAVPNGGGGAVLISRASHPGDGAWHELIATGTASSSTYQTVQLRVSDSRSSGWTAVLLDAIQLERKAYRTTYCDGDEAGCRWLGTRHLSRSYRPASTRAGGRPQSFRALGFTVQSMAGAGMPPVKNLTTDYEYRAGASYQRTAVQARLLTLMVTVDGQRDVAAFHAARDRLLRILAPSRSGVASLLRYTKHGVATRLHVRYDGGLEMTDVRWPLEQFPVRLLAEDPLWESDIERSLVLSTFNQLTIYDGLARRTPEGIWDQIGTQAGDSTGIQINAIAKAPDGTIYAGGGLTGAVVGGTTMALPLMKWTGTAWAQCGSGTTSAGASINTIAFGPDGRVYVGGTFLTLGGVTASNIAIYDPAANTWSAMGSGFNAAVYTICVDTAGVTGRVWAGGAFTARGNGFGGSGIAVGPYVAYFDGTNWFTQLSTNNVVTVITRGADGYLYVGGAFTTINDSLTTISAAGIARWLGPYTGTGSSPNALGSGVNDQPRSIWLDPDTGRLYVAGNFTTAGGLAAYGVAIWTGSGWQALGGFQEAGGAADVFGFFKLSNGDLLAFGRFDSIVSGRPCYYGVAKWTGSDWIPLDGILQGSGAQYVLTAVEASPGELIFGLSATKTLIYYGPSNLVAASGTTYPKLVLAGLSAGLLLTLVNRMTGSSLVLDYQAISGETLALDLRPDRKTLTSSWKGDVTGSIPLATALSTWSLEDGTQDVGLLSTAGGTGTMTWRDRHWSVDTVPLSS